MVTWIKSSRSRPQLPGGERVYAIGDVHGEATLLERLLVQILDDVRRRGPAITTLVLLGDVIDRGPDSAGLLLALAHLDHPRIVLLKGNHEAALVDCYRGDADALTFWLAFGGQSTLAGFGITDDDIASLDPTDLIALLRSRIDPGVVDWVDRLPTTWLRGDYFLVHAGIRPGVRLDLQDEGDLLWIREPFLSSPLDHGAVIVHGHTIAPGLPTIGGNRIGLDTGAHEHGRLTALGLGEDRQWLLQSTADQDASQPAPAGGPANGRTLFDRIERLMSVIVADPGSRDAALLLLPEWQQTNVLRAKAGWVRPAAALIAAGAAGVLLLTTLDRSADDRPNDRPVGAVPDVPPASPPSPRAVATPALAPRAGPPAVPDRSTAGPVLPEATAPRRPPAQDTDAKVDSLKSVVAGIDPDDDTVPVAARATPPARLTGAALERALAEDRAATRRLNEAELARVKREDRR